MVFKIRVFLDTKEDIFRDIEIRDKQTLWNLHQGIISAFALKGDELSVFNLLDEENVVYKSVMQEDLSDDGDGETMADYYVDEAFGKVGDKAQFQFGMLDLWEFFCELTEIQEDKPGVQYPLTVYRFGNVPLKVPGKSGGAAKKSSGILGADYSMEEDFAQGNFGEEEDLFAENFEEDEEDDFPDEPYEEEDY